MIGRTDIGIGSPKHDGLYAVEIFCGWKLLEWFSGEWWHAERVGRWSADIPAQWVGPLPAKRAANKPQAFDL